jgi:hypothetical protein
MRTRSPSSVKPQAQRTPSFGPFGLTLRKIASRKTATSRTPQRSRRLNCSKRSRSSSQILDAVDFESCRARPPRRPTPRLASRGQRTKAPTTIASRGPGAKQLRRVREERRHERLGGLAHLRDLHLQLALGGLHRAGAIAVPKPRVEVAKAALVVGPALITSPAEPGVELVLDRALDDQPRPELGELRERLAGVLADSHGEQLVDLVLDLRRRR